MDALRNLISRYRVVVALIVGLVIGLTFAWVIWPVNYTSVAPVDLHAATYRDFYLAMVADAYNAQKINADEAGRRLGVGTSWSSDQVIKELTTLASTQGRPDKAALESLAAALKTTSPAQTPPPGTNWWLVVCLGALLLALIVVGVVLLLPRLRGEGAPKGPAPAAVRSAQATKTVEATAWAGEAAKPLAQFVTSYEIGDDRYDTSFSIETPTGDFLGECGVGISETIGTGSPDKVTAFEVWLFDKNDIRTVTKVLMSEYAYGDQTLRAKLAPKGEPELARPDAALELETATLKIRARVVEMDYGLGELPPHSFFNKLSLELAAWPKEPAPTA